jgi:hypothetical protein
MGRKMNAMSQERKKSKIMLENCRRKPHTWPASQAEAMITSNMIRIWSQRLFCIFTLRAVRTDL